MQCLPDKLSLNWPSPSPQGSRNASLDRSDLDACRFQRRGEGMATEAQPATQAMRILVVEDEVMIRMLLEDMLGELGYTVAAEAARIDEALEATKNVDFDLAILDANLNGQPVSPIADALVARGTPFVFATGYGELAEPYRDRPTLKKPFQMDGLNSRRLDAREAESGCAGRTLPHLRQSSDPQHLWGHRGRRACQARHPRRGPGQDAPCRAHKRRRTGRQGGGRDGLLQSLRNPEGRDRRRPPARPAAGLYVL